MINDMDLSNGWALGNYPDSAFKILKSIQRLLLDLMHETFPSSLNLSLSEYHLIPNLSEG